MADNKQNSENSGAKQPAAGNETMNAGGGGAASSPTGGSGASTKQAKEGNSSPSNVGGSGSQNASKTKDASSGGKESSENIAGQAIGQVKDKAASLIGDQKSSLASGIGTVADSIRQIGENLRTSDENNQIASLVGKYGDTLAERVEKFSGYIEDRELKELVRDVETFARRNPALFVGAAFTLGVVAARFMKSSSQASKNRARNS
jgi:hypothetical protein